MLTWDNPSRLIIATQCASRLSAMNTFFFDAAAVAKLKEPANTQ